jgi:hypothetical protein
LQVSKQLGAKHSASISGGKMQIFNALIDREKLLLSRRSNINFSLVQPSLRLTPRWEDWILLGEQL